MALHIDEAVNLLSRTPGTVQSMLGGLPEAWMRRNEGGDTWSPVQVLLHLIDEEKGNWLRRITLVKQAGENQEVVLPPFDMTSHLHADAVSDTQAVLQEFVRLRAQSLEELQALKLLPEDLDRRASHPQLGGVVLRDILGTWVVHDFTHTVQIARVLAKNYREDVGPWKQFLTVLK